MEFDFQAHTGRPYRLESELVELVLDHSTSALGFDRLPILAVFIE